MGVDSEISIKNPKEGRHFTGRPVEGIVKYHLDKEITFRKITLSLVGKGYCSWFQYNQNHSNQQGRQQNNETGSRFKCEGHETIVLKKIQLLDNNTGETVTLSAGVYEQPFKIEIPDNIPPSVKTSSGEIKYNLVLKFKKPGIFNPEKKFKTSLEIYPVADNSITDDPIVFTLDKTLKKLFSSKKHEISVKAELNKGYLTPTSQSKISFAVTNNSDVTVSIKTELLSKIKFKDDFTAGKTVEEVIDHCTVVTPNVPENSAANVFSIIPVPMELATVRHSNIISREFKLRVTLKLPLPHINESVKVPVFIGERLIEGLNESVEGESSEARAEPPAYSDVMAEDKSKDKHTK